MKYLCTTMAKNTDEILESLLLPHGSEWSIKSVRSDDSTESIYVVVEYVKPDIVIAGMHFPIYDFRPERVWRHLDMWQYKTFIKARIPRCKLPNGKYTSVAVPWADAGERMTALLEKKR